MHLKYNRQQSIGRTIVKLLFKAILALIVIIVGIFLIRKITAIITSGNKTNLISSFAIEMQILCSRMYLSCIVKKYI